MNVSLPGICFSSFTSNERLVKEITIAQQMNSFVVEVIFLYVAPVEVNKNEDQRTVIRFFAVSSFL